MTFAETFFDFDEEVDRLNETIEDLEAEIDQLETEEQNNEDVDNSQQIEAHHQLIAELQSQRKGVVWARDQAFESNDFPQWDEDVDGVTLGALRAGAYGKMRDDLEADAEAGGGTSSTLLVAEGTVDAPYIDDSMSDVECVGAVAELHPFYREWASSRVNELVDPEASIHDEGNANDSDDSPARSHETET